MRAAELYIGRQDTVQKQCSPGNMELAKETQQNRYVMVENELQDTGELGKGLEAAILRQLGLK